MTVSDGVASVVVLQHPQEQDEVLGSVPLLLELYPNAEKRVGLSWPSFSAAIGRDESSEGWVVLYPSSLKRELTAAELAAPAVFLDRNAKPLDDVRGVIALDGTWSQAKALWWRNAWMLKLGRVILHPKEPSIYGKLRKEPKRTYVSTLESIALVLDALGEDPSVGKQLRSEFRRKIQRIRDATPPR